MDSNIREWLALENIVTKKFKQKYLAPLLPDKKDKCSEEEINKDCESRNNNNCQIYSSSSTNIKTCVTKTRIKRFESTEKSPIIYGKNGNSYRLMSTVKFDGIIKGNEIYYYVFLSLSTSNIYILFSTGPVFTKDEFQNTELKSFLQELISKILQEVLSSEQKVIICGHSMGCVLSLYTGMMIQKTNEDFFNSKIIIIGSAPFKYSNDSLFSNLPNVKIFVFCQIEDNNDNKKNAIIDCFVDKGPNAFNYNPLTYFTEDYNNNNGILIDNINDYTIIFRNNLICSAMHIWENYYSVLTKIYPFNTIKRVGGRIRSHKLRRKKRRTLKKTESRK